MAQVRYNKGKEGKEGDGGGMTKGQAKAVRGVWKAARVKGVEVKIGYGGGDWFVVVEGGEDAGVWMSYLAALDDVFGRIKGRMA